jgi:hypothetical protein
MPARPTRPQQGAHRPFLIEPDSIEPDSIEPDSIEPDSIEPDSIEPDRRTALEQPPLLARFAEAGGPSRI